MERRTVLAVAMFVWVSSITGWNAQAERHRATRLGNPATRFAAPLATVEDLRARFSDKQLQPDFAEILRQWRWPGNWDDLLAAGLTNEVSEWAIFPGDTVPFMASREDGKPVCLRNVTWAGTEPVRAYAFLFHSNGRTWRCLVPKPCCNFYLEDLGPEPRAGLAIECDAPDKVVVGRQVDVHLTLRNTGNIAEPQATVVLPVPDAAVVTSATEDGVVMSNSLMWTILNLPANAARQMGVVFKAQKTGTLKFNPAAGSAMVAAVCSSCETEVIGIPAILLEKTDDPDPVSVGGTTTYTVKVTNQGTADDANVQVVVTLAPELVPISTSEGTYVGRTVTLPVVARLAPKDAVAYKIIAKGVSAGDGHTKFTLTSDVLKSPLIAEESTTIY